MGIEKFFEPEPPVKAGWRSKWFHVIFGDQTFAGRLFDIALIIAISVSVVVAMGDSIPALHEKYGFAFYLAEWSFTILFTAEYIIRLLIVRQPIRYATSFYGIIDILSVAPTYLALLWPGMQFLIVLRVLRILRIFKILHLKQYVYESWLLIDAFTRSARKIFIFLLTILTIVTIFGAVMFLVEGGRNGFTSIPMAMYWAVVTVGTVGYGDIAPVTPIGRLIASILILIGYGIIAVPTGIYTAELISGLKTGTDKKLCEKCGLLGHDGGAKYCRRCGTKLPPDNIA